MRVTQVLDLPVNRDGERGLLGIAVHPDFAAAVDPKPWVYLYYTASPAPGRHRRGSRRTNQVDPLHWNGDRSRSAHPTADPHAAERHLDPQRRHAQRSGPTQKLYGVIGDNNRDGQLQNNTGAAAPPDNTSSVVRVNDDGTLPTDNPLDADMDGADPLDALYRVRRPQLVRPRLRSARAGASGTARTGPTSFDEINLVVPGFNSGWRDSDGARRVRPPAGLVILTGSTYVETRRTRSRSRSP